MIIKSINMNVFVGFFVVFLINLHTPNAYVLVQVQKKDDNLSNVDAIIHKTVPSDRVHELTSKINRKQFLPQVKQYLPVVKPETEVEPKREVEPIKEVEPKREVEPKKEVEPKTEVEPKMRMKPKMGVKPDKNMRANYNTDKRNTYYVSVKNDEQTKGSLRDVASVIEILLGNLASFTQNDMRNRAFLSKKGKPVSFRSGPKGSMMYELNSDNIIASLNNVLSSKPMKRLVDEFSKQAANVVRKLKYSDRDRD